MRAKIEMFEGNADMNDRNYARPLEYAFAFVTLFLMSGVLYGAFGLSTESSAGIGQSGLYKMVWATLYFLVGWMIALRFRLVLPVFAFNFPVTLFALAYLLSEIVNSDEHGDLIRLLSLYFTFAFCAWLAAVFSLEKIVRLLVYVMFAVIPVHVVNLILFGTKYGSDDVIQRQTLLGFESLSGLFGHKNLAGLAFAVGVALFLTLLLDRSQRYNRKLLFAGLVLSGLCLLLTGAALAIIVVVVIFSVMIWMSSLNTRRAIWTNALGVVALCGAIAVAYDPDWALGLLGRSSDLTGRTVLWAWWSESFLEKPWIGYGYTGFFVPGGPVKILASRLSLEGGIANFHNSLLDIGIQTGVIGLSLFCLITALGLWRGAVVAIRSHHALTTFPFAVLVGLCVHAFGESDIPLHNGFSTVIFFTMFFKVSALYRNLQRKPSRHRLRTTPSPLRPPEPRPAFLSGADRGTDKSANLPMVT
ncbi:O-antigen ligase family protein [Blastochloris sulfoviridis]|uniref:O-antigen ligase family protein n=1 Tax=Blastochloris sulfoviridis TaxID=50712 RepID=A0A5M6HQR7_9HYPH|nr:O-antigen ligase family protein [Blastochloris sulfoviridis]KAA5598190.1 O-antigen ligase family protein [Blastochloris sulfoviridis]